MSKSTVFEDNHTQSVRLPASTRFPAGVKYVEVRVVGQERIISPINKGWDSFFFGGKPVSDDFMEERAQPDLDTREEF